VAGVDDLSLAAVEGDAQELACGEGAAPVLQEALMNSAGLFGEAGA